MPKKGDLIRVVKEHPDDLYVELIGAVGIYTGLGRSEVFPVDMFVGVSTNEIQKGIEKPYYDCCYQVERITEDEYLCEYTLARLRGETAFTIEELEKELRNAQP